MSVSRPDRIGLEFTRRRLLGAALGCLPAALMTSRARAEGAALRRLIDLHHHFYTPELVHSWGRDKLDPKWTIAASLGDMDANGVTSAFLSIATPGIWQRSDVAGSVHLARSCNERMAQAAQDHPGRFGFFPTLPLPQVDASLAEIGYVLDVLKADGIGLLSSYDEKYLGDPLFAPVFDELNRRHAVVYVHQMQPSCCGNLVPEASWAAFEAPADLTRTLESLLLSGTLTRVNNVRFICASGGGTLPFSAERIIAVSTQTPSQDKPWLAPLPLREALHALYFDSSSVSHAAAWSALMAFTSASQILFGSDHPSSISASLGALRAMEQRSELSRADIEAIEFGNARRLLPQRLG